VALAMGDEHAIDHGNAEGIDQFLQFLQQAAGVGFLGGIDKRSHQERALHDLFPGFDFEHLPHSTRRSGKMHYRRTEMGDHQNQRC